MEFTLKDFFRKTAPLFLIAVLIIALDQFTKWLVTSNLAVGETWAPWPWLLPYARIVHWWNTGVAFGMLQGMNLVFIILAIVVSLGIIYYFNQIPLEDKWMRAALILELSGAVGNLIDRIRLGHVVDFISVGNFAVFNVADSCISVGVVVLLLGVWLQERREKQRLQGVPTDPDGTKDRPVL
jgi:signal peptidase II